MKSRLALSKILLKFDLRALIMIIVIAKKRSGNV